jgi:2-polyprenyl-6-hydroxyphenyl methylase/3-demethylubiquinone-9 3-methyltransferase
MSYHNVDSTEIHKFNRLADKWWDEDGPFKPLHQLNPLRLQFIQDHCDVQAKSIVDIGCGGGILSEGLAKLGAVVTGIDLAEEALAAAKNHLTISNLSINYQKITVEELASQHPQQFDCVTCMEMLEHVPDPLSVIEASGRLVKPGGLLFFSTINRNPKAYLYAIVGAEWLLQLLPKGTHDYAKFIRPSEFATWSRKAGMSIKAMQGIHYQPLTKKYSLSDDTSVNYVICCEKN